MYQNRHNKTEISREVKLSRKTVRNYIDVHHYSSNNDEEIRNKSIEMLEHINICFLASISRRYIKLNKQDIKDIKEYIKELKLGGISNVLKEKVEEAYRTDMSYEGFLKDLLEVGVNILSLQTTLLQNVLFL